MTRGALNLKNASHLQDQKHTYEISFYQEKVTCTYMYTKVGEYGLKYDAVCARRTGRQTFEVGSAIPKKQKDGANFFCRLDPQYKLPAEMLFVLSSKSN